MILVDSSVWIDYFNGVANAETDFLDGRLGLEPVATADLITLEVLQGFRGDKVFCKARDLFSDLPAFEILGKQRALQAARNYRTLRRRGVTVSKTVDNIIASFCISEHLPLLFTDRDFDPFVRYLGLQAAF